MSAFLRSTRDKCVFASLKSMVFLFFFFFVTFGLYLAVLLHALTAIFIFILEKCSNVT